MSGEPERKAERREEGKKKEGGMVRMGDRDRLQHLTACPGELLKVIEREKDTYGGTQDREKETCIVARG